MVVYTKAAFAAKFGFERGQTILDDISTSEVNHLATARAYQMMVVLWCTGSVAGAVVAGMELADEVQFRQQLEGAVDGYQADTGLVPADLFKNRCRCEVVLAGGKGAYHRASLRSELVAVPLQGGNDTSIG